MTSDFFVFAAIIVAAISLAVLAVTSVAALLIYLNRRNRGKQ
jgi:heme exporter protein D